ncbi:hypothetical protein CEP54_006710 [Fusarium duplospermum]|uniref:TauD/TfdA-like domain-containing protein n=1 Tax=Fusarium duplospermum TaxID=1325734 RepID=A0A428Q5A0_9HYPO|nr:hypothetical protein CEP54_006710 [Fusarium duplospermum]
MDLPAGFPEQLRGPMAWDASDLDQNPEAYTLTLTESDLLGIGNAVNYFKSLGLPRGSVDRSNFPLPENLTTKLRHINDTLNNGRGFQVVRGIEPASYSEEEHILVFAGICAHVATHRNWFIDHIRHERQDDMPSVNLRPPELPVSMDFHTDVDSGPILALFVEKKSKSGGNQHLSSFWTIYNSLARESPEVIRELASSWHWEKPDKENLEGPNIVMPSRPIIGKADGRMQINYAKAFLAGHPKYPMNETSPSLSPQQEAALKILADTARRHSLQLDTEAGDLVLVNNLSIMHARDAFDDDELSGEVRHILRLWLQDQDSWPVASSLGYIEPEKSWHVPDEYQSLRTLSEWVQLPRPIRAVDSAQTDKHD